VTVHSRPRASSPARAGTWRSSRTRSRCASPSPPPWR